MFNIKKTLTMGVLMGALSVIPYTAHDGATEAPAQVKERSAESEVAYRRGDRRSYRGRKYYRRGGYRYQPYRYYYRPYYRYYGPRYYYNYPYYYDRYNRPRSGIYFRFGW